MKNSKVSIVKLGDVDRDAFLSEFPNYEELSASVLLALEEIGILKEDLLFPDGINFDKILLKNGNYALGFGIHKANDKSRVLVSEDEFRYIDPEILTVVNSLDDKFGILGLGYQSGGGMLIFNIELSNSIK